MHTLYDYNHAFSYQTAQMYMDRKATGAQMYYGQYQPNNYSFIFDPAVINAGWNMVLWK
jgi:hypothetical protein